MTLSRADYIPTPWARKLQRMRGTVLPTASFFGCVLLVSLLWQRQGQFPNAVGEVEAVRIDVAAGTDGILAPMPRGQWTLFDRVEANTVLARLDDRPVRAEMATLRAELAQLHGELSAAAERIELDQSGREHDHQREWRRLAWQAQQHRLDVLDRRALIEVDRVEEMRLERELAFLEPLLARSVITEMEVVDQRLRRDEVRKRIEQNELTLAEAKKQLDYTSALLSDYPAMRTASVARLLGPVEAAITVGERRLDELQVRIDGLQIRAPIGGTVCAIHAWPGQNLSAGDPVITVAADQARYIVSYVRQEQRVQPQVGMPVMVRVRGSSGRLVESVVERIGPQVEPVPLHQQRDPNVPEWGLPVCIQPPAQLRLRPGELIDITFQKGRATDRSGHRLNEPTAL